ncbi:MAG: D-alanyl-D-alanine carboxypeptidase [candidate division WWE3 bacterium GW2011_GWA1_46_21]|uniref:D-alanyl-D-alanine carboxypeptidase n=1 Tax=candidate division WWE3 bacterium GW2011_GWA1_46_21 TaxID=1619107 RepID=A0A0G1PE57_UNCKA|nr:MAG: D-alanyl-D-alanine carboxypeptidase [candidate division WWE3 bacterium GW2011_GWA1_46_21]
MSTAQKIKVYLLLGVANAVYGVDCLKDIPDRLAHAGFRISVYAVLATFAVSAILVEATGGELGVASVFGSQNVLGAAVSKKESPRLVVKQAIPQVTSKALYAVDVKSGKVLVAVNEDEKQPPASTTKLMTALVAMDLYRLEDTVQVPAGCKNTGSQEVNLYPGESLTVHNLLYALLISSAGDAACTLAGGKVDIADFVAKMNEKAAALGMTTSHFSNPIGLDGPNGDHVSTARDLFVLAKVVATDPFLKKVVNTKEYLIANDVTAHRLTNTNDLLWNLPGSVGIKTGRTYAAGEVLAYEYADDAKDIIIVVMGSNDRFTDTKAILQWILDSYTWE